MPDRDSIGNHSRIFCIRSVVLFRAPQSQSSAPKWPKNLAGLWHIPGSLRRGASLRRSPRRYLHLGASVVALLAEVATATTSVSGETRRNAPLGGEQESTTRSTAPLLSRPNSLRPWGFRRFCPRPPEPKVTGSNPVGDTSEIPPRYRGETRPRAAGRGDLIPYLFTPLALPTQAPACPSPGCNAAIRGRFDHWAAVSMTPWRSPRAEKSTVGSTREMRLCPRILRIFPRAHGAAASQPRKVLLLDRLKAAGDLASMGPRLLSRGRITGRFSPNASSSSFNGAAASQPRKARRVCMAGAVGRGFNGAAASQPRKGASNLGWRVGTGGFNGAAASQPRKVDKVLKHYACGSCFNGAAASQPRKADLWSTGSPRARARFNGAAASQPRKGGPR